jgi:hypothetical protein
MCIASKFDFLPLFVLLLQQQENLGSHHPE